MPRQITKAQHSLPIDPQLSRINKVLAAAGLGSRRQVEELVQQGRVEINGQTVTDLAARVDPQTAKIKVDGETLKRPKLVYYALNKPKGVLSTNHDPSGRPRVVDFVPDRHRVFSVGRLDQHSEGLMLLTNDGSLAQRLAHPRFRVQKTYFVVVAGIMTLEELKRLRKGVYLAEGVARIDGARIRRTRKSCTELEILLSEGKNREIRRILARAGHKVVLLRRISIGPLRLGEIPVGAARELTPPEVQALYSCTIAQKKTKATSDPSRADKQAANVKKATGKSRPVEQSMSSLGRGMHTGYQSTPLNQPNTDDFGLGLDDDFSDDDHSGDFAHGAHAFPQEFQFNEENLATLETESDLPEDDDWDDDFATDFSVARRSGSVIGADDIPHRSTGKSNQGNRSADSGRKVPSSARRSTKRRPRAKSPKGIVRSGKTLPNASTKSSRTPAKKRASSRQAASKSTGHSSRPTASKSNNRNTKGTHPKGSSGKRTSIRGLSGKGSPSRGTAKRSSGKKR